MQKSQTKRGGLPFVRSGIFIDWTVKNAVFRCNRYVALPAIIPHGRGEGERLIHGGDGDVGIPYHNLAHGFSTSVLNSDDRYTVNVTLLARIGLSK